MKLLVGTAKGVFKSDGSGGAAPVAGLEERSVRALARVNGTTFAGADDGVYCSHDGGSWQRVAAEGKTVWDLAIAPDGSGAVYAGTEPPALFRTEDCGRSWNEIESFRSVPGAERWRVPGRPPRAGRARTVALDGRDPRRWWVGVEVGGVVRSADAGASWQVGLPGNNPDIHVLGSNPARPGMLFATTGYGRIDGVAEMVEGNAG